MGGRMGQDTAARHQVSTFASKGKKKFRNGEIVGGLLARRNWESCIETTSLCALCERRQ